MMPLSDYLTFFCKFRAEKLMFDTQGVCESVLYGTPHILKPTTCWKLDWEELERNHHHFNALCQLLQNRVRKDQTDLFPNLCSSFIGKRLQSSL